MVKELDQMYEELEGAVLPDEAKRFIDERVEAAKQAYRDERPGDEGVSALLALLDRWDKESLDTHKYSLRDFISLHMNSFRERSICLLDITPGLVLDLMWEGIYFIDELIAAIEAGKLDSNFILTATDDEFNQGLAGLAQIAKSYSPGK